MSGYAFHLDGFAVLDEISENIAQDNVDAADRVLADIHSPDRRRLDIDARTWRPARYDSMSRAMSTLSRTHPTRSRFGLRRLSTGAEIRG
jgi:hypothetical protein